MSHAGSGSGVFDFLNKQENIEGFRTGVTYDHPDALSWLTSRPHKCDNTMAIYMDELLHNYSLTCKSLCKYCKFVFFVRDPRECLGLIDIHQDSEEDKEKSIQSIANYYCYRLRGMFEYYKRCVDEPLVIKLSEGKSTVQGNIGRYLNITKTEKLWNQDLSESINKVIIDATPATPVPEKLIQPCLECFQHYFGFLG
jgi:hypothetical protein